MGVDDLVAAVRAVTTVASHPKIHAMTGIDHREYYIQNTAETLCRHAMDAQRAIWPAIEVDCASPVLLTGGDRGLGNSARPRLRRGPTRRGRLLACRRRPDP